MSGCPVAGKAGDPDPDPTPIDPEELAVRAAQFEAIVTHAVDAIITIDAAGMILSVNPATLQLFGYRSDELLGRNVNVLMPHPDRDRHDDYLSRYLNTGVAKIIGYGREVTAIRRDGSRFPVLLGVSEFKRGSERCFIGILRDISDRKVVQDELERLVQSRTEQLRQTQEQLIRRERLATLGQVAGGIAHEIRNPLNVIKTSVYYLLNRQAGSEDKVREHLQRIDRQVTLAESVIAALSDFARLPDPVTSPIDVHRLIEAALQTVSLSASIRVVMDVPAGIPAVAVDTAQLQIVLRNLIRNARDAMPGGGEIHLKAVTRSELIDDRIVQRVCVHVRDTGHGIPTDQLARILEPLYTTKARGMGLGLAISRSIIEKHRGSLAVESVLNHGSTFTVCLPIAEPDQA